MGKATINASLGAGLYSITVDFDNTAVTAKIAGINEKISALTAKLSEVSARKATALSALESAQSAIDVFINATTPETINNSPARIVELSASVTAARNKYLVVANEEKNLLLKKTGFEKERDDLTANSPSTAIVEAWCVAYIENLIGTTETIEVDYIGGHYWLLPTIAAPATILQTPHNTSHHATWFNLCMLPAIQKDLPKYRIATILSVNDTLGICTIIFDGHLSVDYNSTRSFDLDPVLPLVGGVQEQIAENVVIEYPDYPYTSNTHIKKLFVINDKVIVDCHLGLYPPRVIGFYSNPIKSFYYNNGAGMQGRFYTANGLQTATRLSWGNHGWAAYKIISWDEEFFATSNQGYLGAPTAPAVTYQQLYFADGYGYHWYTNPTYNVGEPPFYSTYTFGFGPSVHIYWIWVYGYWDAA